MARLRFDQDCLVITPLLKTRYFGPTEMQFSRRDTTAVRLSTGIFAVRVSVIRSDGKELEPYFKLMSRGPVRQALRQRDWPVVEDRWQLGYRS
jgi:hypothetical protein